MANVCSGSDALLRDYNKLSEEYQGKASRYIKNLLRLQRAEQRVKADINIIKVKTAPDGTGKYHCSFCNKTEDEVERLITSSGRAGIVYICNECVETCCEIIEEYSSANDSKESSADGGGTP